MLPLFLALALGQAAPPTTLPTAADAPSAARLLFQAGDLRRAIATAKACAGAKKKGHKECAAMVKPLVEYQTLAGKREPLTPAEARALLAYQQQISPEVPSKLSAEAQRRFVDGPYEQAVAARLGGDEALARTLAQRVLEVWPHHEGAQALLGSPDAGVRPRKGAKDAGAPADGGR